MAEEGNHLTAETLIAVLVLVFYTIAGSLFKKYEFKYAHESGICMVLGIIVTFFANLFNKEESFAKTFDFSYELFFTFILPPIIFGAGYNLRKKFFFKYLFYIFLFGVIGTIVNFCCVAPLTLLVNNNRWLYFTNKSDIFDKNGNVRKEIKNLEPKKEDRRILHTEYNGNLVSRLLGEAATEIKSHDATPLASDLKSSSVIEDKSNSSIEGKENNSASSNTEEKSIKESASEETAKSSDISSEIQAKETESKSKKESNSTDSSETEDDNGLHIDQLILSTKEILLFASVISATDAVAALAFVDEDSDPKLFPILFGEGVVNDAVCIVLYQIIKKFLDSGERKYI